MREATLLVFGIVMFCCYSISRLFELHREATTPDPATVDLVVNPPRC